eukprot:Rhum_TRINITY_DN15065_c9_g4::Rhum_TRINITY_DN15065_c9_g4_i7::g.137337::m.137337
MTGHTDTPEGLPVGLAVEPATREVPDQPLPQLVVRDDEDREREGRKPVDEPELLDAEHRAHTRDVDEHERERRLEEESEVQLVVLHALVEQRQTTRLADQDVRPLHNHDRRPERGLRGPEDPEALADREAPVRETLRHEVALDVAVVRQLVGRDALRVEHHEEAVESGKRLHNSDLEVRERDQALRHQVVVLRTRRTPHDVLLLLLVRQRDGRHHVGTQVDAQNQHRRERKRDLQDQVHNERRDLRDVRRQRVRDRLLQVVEDQTALQHTVHDRREVVVHQDHVRSLLRHVHTGDTHADTDVGGGHSLRVVDTVTRHGHNLLRTTVRLLDLEVLHNQKLLRRRRTREHETVLPREVERPLPVAVHRLRVPARDTRSLNSHRSDRLLLVTLQASEHPVAVRLQVRARLARLRQKLRKDHVLLSPAVLRDDTDVTRDGGGRLRLVTRHHDDTDRRLPAHLHGTGHGRTRGVLQGDQTQEHNLRLEVRRRRALNALGRQVRAHKRDLRLARNRHRLRRSSLHRLTLLVRLTRRPRVRLEHRLVEVVLLLVVANRSLEALHRLNVHLGEREHTQTVRRKLGVRLSESGAVRVGQRGRVAVRSDRVRAEVEHDVRSSLDPRHEVLALAQRPHVRRHRHPLVLRVERQLVHRLVLQPRRSHARPVLLALLQRPRAVLAPAQLALQHLLHRVDRHRQERVRRRRRVALLVPDARHSGVLELLQALLVEDQDRALRRVAVHVLARRPRQLLPPARRHTAAGLLVLRLLELRRPAEGRALHQLVVDRAALAGRLRAPRRALERVGRQHLALHVRPHRRHLVHRQRARLVGADHTRRPERLHSLQVLHQHHDVLHPLRRQRQRHRHRRQQTLRHVRHNDTDREHDGVHRDSLVQRDVDDQEHHSEHNRDRRDDLHEPVQLLPDRRVVLHLLRLEHHHVVPAHHRLVARRHSHAPRLAERDVRALHHNVLLAQRGQRRVLRHRRALLHLERLAGQRRLHDREPALRAQHTHVARDLVSQLDVQHVARHDQAGVHGRLRAVAHHARLALTHRLELLHHLSRRSLLLVREDRRDQHDREQHNAEEKVLLARASRRALNTVRNEAQHTSGNQKHREETRELQQELHNLRQVLRRGQRVLAVDVDHLVHLVRRQTLRVRRVLHVDVPGVALLQVEHLVVVLRAREVRARELAVHRELVQVTHLLRRLQVAHVALHPGLRLLLQLVARRAALPKDILLQLGRLLLRGCRLSRHSRPPASLFLSFR